MGAIISFLNLEGSHRKEIICYVWKKMDLKEVFPFYFSFYFLLLNSNKRDFSTFNIKNSVHNMILFLSSFFCFTISLSFYLSLYIE